MQYFLIFQAFLTLFISGGIFFKENKLKNRTIAFYFLIFSLEILYFVYGTSSVVEDFPELFGRFYYSIGLIYGPLLWFHFKSILTKKDKFKIVDALHFVPVILVNLLMIDMLMMPGSERFVYMTTPEIFDSRVMTLNYIRLFHQSIYAIAIVFLFREYRKVANVNEKFYLGGIALLYLATTIVIGYLTLFANSWLDFNQYYIVCNSLIFIVGYILY